MTNIFDEPKKAKLKVFPVRTPAMGFAIGKLIEKGALVTDENEFCLVQLNIKKLKEVWKTEMNDFESPDETSIVSSLQDSFEGVGGHLKDEELIIFRFYKGWKLNDTERAGSFIQELEILVRGFDNHTPGQISLKLDSFIMEKKEQLGNSGVE